MDPRVVPAHKRQANLSRLMQLQRKAGPGQIVNVCPFGCKGGEAELPTGTEEPVVTVGAEDLEATLPNPDLEVPDQDLTGDMDNNGYCRHLIGFTIPGSKAIYEPLEMDPQTKRRRTNGKKRLAVQPGDKLVRVTTSYRVYRKLPEELSDKELERLTAPKN